MGWLSRKKPEPVKPLPFCVDCKWMRPDRGSALKFAKCGHPQSRSFLNCYELVTGDSADADLLYCSVMRGLVGRCGAEGRLFEPMYIDLEAVHIETKTDQNRIKMLDNPKKGSYSRARTNHY